MPEAIPAWTAAIALVEARGDVATARTLRRSVALALADRTALLAESVAIAGVRRLATNISCTASEAQRLATAVGARLAMPRSTEDADPNVAGVLLGKLFAAQVGDVITAATPKGDGAVVARLKTVLPVDLKAEAIAVQSTRDRLGRNLANDLLSQFQASSQEKVGLTTDETLIQRALAGDSRG